MTLNELQTFILEKKRLLRERTSERHFGVETPDSMETKWFLRGADAALSEVLAFMQSKE